MASTRLNARSSRSHSIITFEVKRNNRVSKLRIVDLAGSERLSMTGVARDPVALAETQSINLSLSTLASVLSILSKPDSESWLAPYRDSKLTMLLRDSLGGSARTVLHPRPPNARPCSANACNPCVCRAREADHKQRHRAPRNQRSGLTKSEKEPRAQLDKAMRILMNLKSEMLANSRKVVAIEEEEETLGKELAQSKLFLTQSSTSTVES